LVCFPHSSLNILACVSRWKVLDQPLPYEHALLAHFSENWGFMSLSPLLGGNIFSITFGRILDSHTPMHNTTIPVPSDPLSLSAQCLEGRQCYVSSLYITIVACFVALIISVWVGYRDRRRMTATDMMSAGEVVWEELDDQ
jgi:hypothetical protein